MHSYNLMEKLMFCPRPFSFKTLQQAMKGKTLLITGASSGIGKELAYLLADCEVHIVLVARREIELHAIQETMQSRTAEVTVIPGDLREESDMQKVLTFLHALPNGLDVVVNNAGISINRSINQSLQRYHDFTRTMAINYFAPVRILLSVIPLLEKNKGHIINVSTINVLMTPMPDWAAYQASKTAFDTWLRSSAAELKLMGINASTVYLPLVKTPMIKPTLAYKRAPAMSALHAAEEIATIMCNKKKGFQPWWILPIQAASVFIRQLPRKNERSMNDGSR